MTKISVELNTITLTDEQGHTQKIKTLRSVDELAEYIQETEKEVIIDKLSYKVGEAIEG